MRTLFNATETRIPFNRPSIEGNELEYVIEAIRTGQIGADRAYTQRCTTLLETRFAIKKVLLTTSCTVALELAAMLTDMNAGDEVIMPSFTFVSTANAFVRREARPVFVDIRPDTLNIDETRIEAAITPRTRAIVPVHYAGVGCHMEPILEIAHRRRLTVIEDAAQGLSAHYQGRALGSLGQLGAYSFHETKNCVCGEGGALCVNDPDLIARAEILHDKGTNRKRFLRGEVDKYTWIDVGCSAAPAELVAAFLYAQLERMDEINERRRQVSVRYRRWLEPLERAGRLRLPCIPEDCHSNNHIFYIILNDGAGRDSLIARLAAAGVSAAFHYVPLHSSPMGRAFGYGRNDLPVTEDLSARLLRLPCYPGLSVGDQERVVGLVHDHLKLRRSARAKLPRSETHVRLREGSIHGAAREPASLPYAV